MILTLTAPYSPQDQNQNTKGTAYPTMFLALRKAHSEAPQFDLIDGTLTALMAGVVVLWLFLPAIILCLI